MGLNLKNVKVESLKYHIYDGDKEAGAIYWCKPDDAVSMAERGLVKLVKSKPGEGK